MDEKNIHGYQIFDREEKECYVQCTSRSRIFLLNKPLSGFTLSIVTRLPRILRTRTKGEKSFREKKKKGLLGSYCFE